MLVELLLTVVFVVGITAAVKAWLRHQTLRKTVNKIPGMGDLPLIGSALHMKTDNLGFFNQLRELSRLHSDKGIFKLWMGPRPMVFVFKPNTVEGFLNSTKHTRKAFSYELFLKQWLGDGLLISYGQKWYERRKLITPTFHFQILAQFIRVFNEQAAVLVKILESKANDPPFDFTPYIFRCMLDVICETAMGVKVNAQHDSNSAFVKAVYRESDLQLRRLKYPWLWFDSLYRLLPTGREDTSCLKILHGLSRKVIKDRMEELVSKKAASADQTAEKTAEKTGDDDDNIYTSSKRRRLAFVDMLLTEESLSADDVQEEVDTFMFEGHDTTASGMVWLLYMLACYPELQLKVQQEIDSIFGSDKQQLTMEDVQKLSYTEHFIKETLRLYPPVSWVHRTTTEQCEIGGYTVPKDISVALLIFEIHRDPQSFPNPEQFNPDRWLDHEDGSGKRHPFSYIPFSAGLRNCIGQRFAMLELKVTLCHLMRNFTIAGSFKREDLVPTLTLILKPHDPLPIQFIRRKL